MDIYNVLNQLNINYEEVKHKSVCTVQEAINLGISKMITGIECKNLFVKMLDNKINIHIAIVPIVKLKMTACFVICFIFSYSFKAIFFETIWVIDIAIPDVARVIAKT